MLAGCASSSAGAPTPPTPSPTNIFAEDLTIKSPAKVETEIPCDDPIITFGSWFCPTYPGQETPDEDRK